ncbi:MAG TPA: XRE family transcriptional regulator [Mucilaginibacter sp.]
MAKQEIMNTNVQWFLIETEEEYHRAVARYEQVKHATKDTEEHKEKVLLVHLINEYENKTFEFPEVDPIEMIKIRMEDFGYKPADLAKVYGDKGTVSKVLNYKQPLSLTMIRKFSELLRIPVESLIKEYELKVTH